MPISSASRWSRRCAYSMGEAVSGSGTQLSTEFFWVSMPVVANTLSANALGHAAMRPWMKILKRAQMCGVCSLPAPTRPIAPPKGWGSTTGCTRHNPCSRRGAVIRGGSVTWRSAAMECLTGPSKTECATRQRDRSSYSDPPFQIAFGSEVHLLGLACRDELLRRSVRRAMQQLRQLRRAPWPSRPLRRTQPLSEPSGQPVTAAREVELSCNLIPLLARTGSNSRTRSRT
jgi:hypothetical protein